ncbi:hypothetical protein AGMMS50262_02550 [Bacteroidia bacterium]|nr:hypothetical protein AGMMS50262_02550 [Bacteroidia bacterium]
MKLIKYFTVITGCLSVFALTSCDNYEAVPIERFTIDYVFSPTDSLGTNAMRYLNSIYYAMQSGHPTQIPARDYLDAATDDAITSAVSENDIQRLASGQYSAASRIDAGSSTPNSIIGQMDWGNYYIAIRQAITFVNHIDEVPLMLTFTNNAGDTISMTRAWKAEARFLKAFFYFEMVKRYGGVPLMDDTHPAELSDDMELPRNTFEECINYIVNELDAIKDSLRTVPLENSAADGHVVTQGAAMALKSRVLLYAASPLFNENPLEKGNELIGYAQYDQARWKKAADAARWFMDTYAPAIYDLDRLPAVGSTPGFVHLFVNDYTSNNKEIIFFRQGSKNHEIEKINGPIGFSGTNQSNGRTSPTQNLVDAFPMKDGKAIDDPTSKYTYTPLSQSMYDNRDPRMGLTVMYNNSRWLKTNLETFNKGVNNPGTSAQTTKTSYYMRKFMGQFAETSEYNDNNVHCWILFRYAEILLNFAEAQNEYAGPTQEVYDQLIDLRKRAGIEAGTDKLYGLKANMTKEEMREIIHNERRIEMAFEEQRYWDIRRWRIAEDLFKTPLYGMLITRVGSSLNFERKEVAFYTFESKRYFLPIPYSEVIKNKNMKQNPGW